MCPGIGILLHRLRQKGELIKILDLLGVLMINLSRPPPKDAIPFIYIVTLNFLSCVECDSG